MFFTLIVLPKKGEVHIFKHRLYISALEQARVLILLCSSRSHKHNLLTLSRLSDFVKCR